jgi:polyisoprenoid-binding protein YceI
MRFFYILCVLFLSGQATAQSYFSRTAHVHLKTSNRFMDVEGDNYQVFAQLDPTSGTLTLTALLKSFEFQLGAANRVLDSKALNVSQYPKANFEGRITNLEVVDFNRPGNYKVKIDGMLYVWDEKRRTSSDAVLTVRPDGSLYAKSSFIMIIEKQNVDKVNQLMREKLPDLLNIDTNTLGISRNIYVDMTMALTSM